MNADHMDLESPGLNHSSYVQDAHTESLAKTWWGEGRALFKWLCLLYYLAASWQIPQPICTQPLFFMHDHPFVRDVTLFIHWWSL